MSSALLTSPDYEKYISQEHNLSQVSSDKEQDSIHGSNEYHSGAQNENSLRTISHMRLTGFNGKALPIHSFQTFEAASCPRKTDNHPSLDSVFPIETKSGLAAFESSKSAEIELPNCCETRSIAKSKTNAENILVIVGYVSFLKQILLASESTNVYLESTERLWKAKYDRI